MHDEETVASQWREDSLFGANPCSLKQKPERHGETSRRASAFEWREAE